ENQRRDDPAELWPRQLREAEIDGEKPSCGARNDRERRQQADGHRGQPREDRRSDRNVDTPQDRADDETHEEVDTRPQNARHDVDPVEEPEVADDDRRDHHGDCGSDVPEVVPANQLLRECEFPGERCHSVSFAAMGPWPLEMAYVSRRRSLQVWRAAFAAEFRREARRTASGSRFRAWPCRSAAESSGPE